MDEAKVVRYVATADGMKPDNGPYVQFSSPYRNAERWVTHADYRAVEEHRAIVEFLLKIEREAHEATLQELASIKARVGELVAADHEYDICLLEFRDAYNEVCEETEDLADDVSGASERRRLALDAFK